MKRNADWVWLVAIGLGLSWLARPVAAQSCTADADCASGLVCKSYGEVCEDIACPDGESCPSMPQCEEYKQCDLPDCTADADCPDGFVCAEFTYEECSGGVEIDCPAGSECPKPEPAACTETTETACEARYNLPCEVDADCGDGFTCVELESCTCSGSAGGGSDAFAPPADGGGGAPPPPPPEETCDCAPSGERMCELQELPCESASDCPGDFVCEDNPNRPVCGETRPAPAGEQDAGAADQPLPAPECGVDASLPAKVCLPPLWNVGGVGVTRGDFAESGVAASDNAAGSSSGVPQSATGSDNPAGEGADEDGDGASASASSSCAVRAPGASPGALPVLSLLALAALSLHRRRS